MNDTGSTTTDRPQVVSRRGTPTWEIAHLFPRQGEWTEEAYLALETNRPIEFTDGCLEFLPLPTLLHQFVLQDCLDRLDAYLRLSGTAGIAIFGPVPVRLRSGKYREPDLLYLRPGRIRDLQTPPEGADLVMEIVSPGAESRKRDFEQKRGDYAEAGIPEYWIVDPELREITVLVLEGSAYHEHGRFAAGTTAASVVLPGFQVAVDAAFAVVPPEQP